jgi:hypothetical protein
MSLDTLKEQLNSDRSPYSYYLDLLGQCPTSIALASQWFITFDFRDVGSLFSNLQDILNDRETSGWNYNKDVTKYLLDSSLQSSTNNLIGCAFARQVKLPSESINASHTGLEYGGFQAPATSSGREQYNTFSVFMLETNASFIDLILRPWTIAVGYNGLVAREIGPKYVKAKSATIYMLAKTGQYSRMAFRKAYTFYNVAPVKIFSEEYSYAEEGLRGGEVEFVYDRYTVSDLESGVLINLP